MDRPDIEGDLTGFIPIATPRGKVVTPRDKFLNRLAEEELKATKLSLPFANGAAKADVEDLIKTVENQWKRQGYVDKNIKDKLNLNSIDWAKYSDLKNFKILDEGTVSDKNLSKVHRLPVFVKFKKYQFKGMKNTYTVMESEEEAVQRAQDALDNRKTTEKK